MPTPEWSDMDYDPTAPVHTGVEIMGRGPNSRRSKTYLHSLELADVAGRVRSWYEMLLDLMKSLHAKHYTIQVTHRAKDGTETTHTVPHVLTDKEVEAMYPAVRWWRNRHEECVEHMNSYKGFGVNRAVGFDEDGLRGRSERKESSAGTDQAKNGRAENPRWQ